MPYFKAFIRVVKSISEYSFGSENIIEERFIESEDKETAKQYILDKYPQFFQNGKVYSRETKDQAQFFYLLVYPLYSYEVNLALQGEWKCDQCEEIHPSRYHLRPYISRNLFPDKMFCGQHCYDEFKKDYYKDIELPDDECFIKKDSPNYIYKITEKSTGKCYIGKTRNAPFFRWWNHLKHSSSPFGLYLSKTKLSEWIFEVLEEFPAEYEDSKIFEIESKYILQFDSLNNGFNTLISNKSVLPKEDINQSKLEL